MLIICVYFFFSHTGLRVVCVITSCGVIFHRGSKDAVSDRWRQVRCLGGRCGRKGSTAVGGSLGRVRKKRSRKLTLTTCTCFICSDDSFLVEATKHWSSHPKCFVQVCPDKSTRSSRFDANSAYFRVTSFLQSTEAKFGQMSVHVCSSLDVWSSMSSHPFGM